MVATLQTKTARAILAALVGGQADPVVLAGLAQGRLKDRQAELAEAVAGRFRREHHGLLVAHVLAHLDFLDSQIDQLDERTGALLAPVAELVALVATIPGSAHAVRGCCWPSAGWSCPGSPVPRTWRHGPGSVPATTNRLARPDRVAPARAPAGCGPS